MLTRFGFRLPASAFRAASFAAGGLVLSALAGLPCHGSEPNPPRLLSETGLYSAPGKVAPANLPYAPQYPLWSDGAAKTRWVQLPAGTTVDGTKEEAWQFPVGTKFWKEFAFRGRKVETRLMWKIGPQAWRYASYRWNPAQTEAELVSEKGFPNAAEIEPGLQHTIPSVADCQACHDNAGTEILGFSALQLSPDRDPAALHAEPLKPGMVTLKDLVQKGLLTGGRKDLLTAPPSIKAPEGETRALLGYFATNCGSCHRDDAPIPELALDFRHTPKAGRDTNPGLLSSVGRPSLFTLPGQAAADALLIRPGSPETSTVVHRMATRNPDVQMPPLATVKLDEEAVRRVRAWVASLKTAQAK